jgi:hypothetical protein
MARRQHIFRTLYNLKYVKYAIYLQLCKPAYVVVIWYCCVIIVPYLTKFFSYSLVVQNRVSAPQVIFSNIYF